MLKFFAQSEEESCLLDTPFKFGYIASETLRNRSGFYSSDARGGRIVPPFKGLLWKEIFQTEFRMSFG